MKIKLGVIAKEECSFYFTPNCEIIAISDRDQLIKIEDNGMPLYPNGCVKDSELQVKQAKLVHL